jgi:hypothetical protein
MQGANHEGSVANGSRDILRIEQNLAGGSSIAPFDEERGGEGDGDGEGRVRRGAALSALSSPLHAKLGGRMREEQCENNSAYVEERTSSNSSGDSGGSGGGGVGGSGGGVGMGLRRQGSAQHLIGRSASSLDLICELRQADDVTPLATPDVSKHGTNEAWLFIKEQQQRTAAGGGGGGGGDGRTDDTSSIGSDSQSGGAAALAVSSGSGGGGARGGEGSMRRSGSVVSFNLEDEVHCIGSVVDLAKEKKVQTGRSASASALASMSAEMSAVAVAFGLKKKKPACKQVDESWKQARAHMFDNIDHATAVNDKPAWETREASLRGGNAFFANAPPGSSPKPGMGGASSKMHSASSPSLSRLGLEKFVPDDDDPL